MTIKLFTTEICPKCHRLADFLTAQGIEFEMLDMASPEGMTELSFSGIYTTMAPVLMGEGWHMLAGTMFKGAEINKEKILNALNL